MKPILPFLALACMLAAAVPAAGQHAPAAPPTASATHSEEIAGTWVNPKGTVKVKTGLCGADLCGWVVWANAEALADARDAGVDKLIGTMLLKDYHATGPESWQGQVYVPDMGGTYFSRMQRIDPTHLKISGCVLGGLICKSQVWVKD